MSETYHFDFSDFDNNMVHTEAIDAEIKAVMPSGVVYEGHVIEHSGDNAGVAFYFQDSLSPTVSGTLSATVSSHQGYILRKKFVVSSKMVEREFEITATGTNVVDWDVLGGSTTSVSFFLEDVTEAVANTVGELKTVGSGTKLTIVSKPPFGEMTNHMAVPFEMIDTQGAWIPFQFASQIPTTTQGAITYCILGMVPSGTSAHIRFTSTTMLRVYAEYGILELI